MDEINEQIRQAAGGEAGPDWLRQAVRSREQTAYEAAAGKVREAVALQQAAEDEHGLDSPEVRGAEARTDRAFELWRAEQAAEREAEQEAARVDFDGGTRPVPPAGPPSPSMGSLIRAGHEEKRARAVGRAHEIDRWET